MVIFTDVLYFTEGHLTATKLSSSESQPVTSSTVPSNNTPVVSSITTPVVPSITASVVPSITTPVLSLEEQMETKTTGYK